MNLLSCQVWLHSMDSTSIYGLELLVLEGSGGKTLATDHREDSPLRGILACATHKCMFFNQSWSQIGY